MRATLKRIAALILLGSMAIPLSGCAYMFRGTSDQIHVSSADHNAMIYFDNVLIGRGSAPATAKRGQTHTIVAKKEGCSDHSVQTTDKFDGISLLGLLLDLGIISILIVDNATGAMWKTEPLTYYVNPICPEAQK